LIINYTPRGGNLKSERGICEPSLLNGGLSSVNRAFFTDRERAPMGLNKIGLPLSGPTP
jgi:hypothetical protein